MLLGFLDVHSLLTIVHLVGVVIGAGGAFASDLMFFSAIKDMKIGSTDLRYLKLGSRMVWAGIIILIISGSLLFLGDLDRYLNSSKFLAKMVIVAVIIANGYVLHAVHLAFFTRHVGKPLRTSDDFLSLSPYMVMSGAISMVSWMSALILGSLRRVPYSFASIVTAYLLVLAVAVVASLLLRRRILRLG